MPPLPIEAILPQLESTLRERSQAVLIAPPGAGKTTRVPLALLDQEWLAQRRIIMLEPRRLAARNAATWMARQLGESAGQTVGYRMRMDTRVGPETRIEVVTEGILTRLLQRDPSLEDYGLVIFDEFHERSLTADLGLALCQEAQTLRTELRLLIMSATLEGGAISTLLDEAPVLRSEGRSHPVTIRYLPTDARPQRPETGVVAAIHRALEEESGSVLVFLPGTAEIRRVQRDLDSAELAPSIRVLPLYGNLPQQEQEQAIAPAGAGTRKVVLATAIAETSLTIEGVRVIIDAGWMRVPRFDPGSGMTRLHTQRVSADSAEQRCGRAGRTEPGVCYRLWDQQTQAGLIPQRRAEILDADLAPLALELAQWGVTQTQQLIWLDPPPEAAFEQARQLLHSLTALDAEGRISPHGRAMLELGLHPRLAHMVLNAEAQGHGRTACTLAALLEERDLFRLQGADRQSDIRSRVEALTDTAQQQRYRVGATALKRVARTRDALLAKRGLDRGAVDAECAGALLALAYPDRIAQRRPAGRGQFLLSSGKGAFLDDTDPLAQADYLVAAQLDGGQRQARIFLAAPLDEDEIVALFADRIREADVYYWDADKGMVNARRQRRLGALILSEQTPARVDEAQRLACFLAGIREAGLNCLPWDRHSRQWQQRVLFLRRLFPDEGWPDVSDDTLLKELETWLAPYLPSMHRLSQLKSLSLRDILQHSLSWEQQRALEQLAPCHYQVPSGSRIAIDYGQDIPVLAVRLQEMFGLTQTPSIAQGRFALLLHLLSPAYRPIQVTRDLAGFWQNTYAEVKRDLKGRYPKHDWPDDPVAAQATRRAKPRA